MTEQQTYELLEDVPRCVTRVVSQSGRTNATLGIDGRWRRLDGQIVPLDAHGPWIPVQRVREHRYACNTCGQTGDDAHECSDTEEMQR